MTSWGYSLMLHLLLYFQAILQQYFWKWVQRYAIVADRIRISKDRVNEIFVDETLLQIDGIDYWLQSI
jgi:hypothetical protein